VAKALRERMLIACILGMLLNAGSKGSSNIIANEQAAMQKIPFLLPSRSKTLCRVLMKCGSVARMAGDL
jgi:hypothetical protein